jgi:hypothetical protein
MTRTIWPHRRRGCPVQAQLGRVRPECLLEQLADLLVFSFGRNKPMPFQNAPGVGVHNKNWMISRIQKNRVGGFWADPVERQQLISEFGSRAGEHSIERSSVIRIEKTYKDFQALRFLPEVARGTYQLLKFRQSKAADSTERKPSRFAKINQGLLDIRPRGVLSQIRPNNHFEARLRGPPMLLSPGGKQRAVVGADRVVLGLAYCGRGHSSHCSGGVGDIGRDLRRPLPMLGGFVQQLHTVDGETTRIDTKYDLLQSFKNRAVVARDSRNGLLI